MNLFKANRVFTFSNAAALISYAATYAVSFLLSLYLQYEKGLDARQAGLVLLVQPVMQAVFSLPAGRLADRVQPRLPASVGMGLAALGLLLLGFAGKGTGTAFLAAALASIGVGFGLFSSPNTSAIMGSVHHAFYGVASSVLAAVRLTGQMLSMGLVTAILAVAGAGARSATAGPEFLSGMDASFFIMAGLCAAGIFLSLARGVNR